MAQTRSGSSGRICSYLANGRPKGAARHNVESEGLTRKTAEALKRALEAPSFTDPKRLGAGCSMHGASEHGAP